MKKHLALFFLTLTLKLIGTSEVPVIKISDTINPGSADFILSEIETANGNGSPFAIIQLNTPGGLLTSTRQIIQGILNSKIPIVVWIGPRGSQAGSAGALITFAADIAVMATGSNIGAAHPVQGGGEGMDKTLSDKITNDTAAFAEGLAKAKGRNVEWAKLSVTESKSVTAEEALKLKVVDFLADDLASLERQLRNRKLNTVKNNISQLPETEISLKERFPTLKHQVVSFFANPTLAYLILSIGGLCLWIELSHPGLILPGVLGGICVLISLVSFQMLPIRLGALGMILFGIVLLIAELYITSYGVLGIGGIMAFVLGSLYLMDTNVPEFQISTSLIFPVALCFSIAITILSYLIWKSRNLKLSENYLGLVGLEAEANAEITESTGNVFVQGELWKARSQSAEIIKRGEKVLVKEIRGLVLIVTKKGV